MGAGAVALLLLLFALFLAIKRHTKAMLVVEDREWQVTRGGREAREPLYEEVRPVSATGELLASRESLDEEGFLRTNLQRNFLRS